MEDIENRQDIKFLVDAFYKRVLKDEIIGFIFTDIVKINIEEHMPKMYDFWETTLLNKTVYKGNPMKIHIDLNKNIPLTKKHFERWITLFTTTVDENFSGVKSELAKTRALSIATVMQIKIYQSNT